tara:strand:- start:154 stop:339 length:186 start_codon:yes stop_codon:yes gene_type:complete
MSMCIYGAGGYGALAQGLISTSKSFRDNQGHPAKLCRVFNIIKPINLVEIEKKPSRPGKLF